MLMLNAFGNRSYLGILNIVLQHIQVIRVFRFKYWRWIIVYSNTIILMINIVYSIVHLPYICRNAIPNVAKLTMVYTHCYHYYAFTCIFKFHRDHLEAQGSAASNQFVCWECSCQHDEWKGIYCRWKTVQWGVQGFEAQVLLYRFLHTNI